MMTKIKWCYQIIVLTKSDTLQKESSELWENLFSSCFSFFDETRWIIIYLAIQNFCWTKNVDQNYPPTYLANTLVPRSQSVQLANVLKESGVTYILDLVPNVSHVFNADPALWEQHDFPIFDMLKSIGCLINNPTKEKNSYLLFS